MTKKRGILNPTLAGALGKLGHGHMVVIADYGLPLPREAEIVDLTLVHGIPSFSQVLDALLGEIAVEGVVAATEITGTEVEQWLTERALRPDLVSHEEFKELLPKARLIVRSGEATPYANVMLRCGVPF